MQIALPTFHGYITIFHNFITSFSALPKNFSILEKAVDILAHFLHLFHIFLLDSRSFRRILIDLSIDRRNVFCYDNAIQSERR